MKSIFSFMSNNDIDGFERLFIQKYHCPWPSASYKRHLTLGNHQRSNSTKMLQLYKSSFMFSHV